MVLSGTSRYGMSFSEAGDCRKYARRQRVTAWWDTTRTFSYVQESMEDMRNLSSSIIIIIIIIIEENMFHLMIQRKT